MIRVNGVSLRVVGIIPRGFSGLSGTCTALGSRDDGAATQLRRLSRHESELHQRRRSTSRRRDARASARRARGARRGDRSRRAEPVEQPRVRVSRATALSLNDARIDPTTRRPMFLLLARRGMSPAACLRQRRRPAARSRGVAPARDRDSRRDWRVAESHRRATAVGSRTAGGWRRCFGNTHRRAAGEPTRVSVGDGARPQFLRSHRRVRHAARRRAGAALVRRVVRDHDDRVRADAGVSRDARRSHERSQGRRCRWRSRPDDVRDRRSAVDRRRRDGARRRAVVLRRRVDRELATDGDDGSWLRARRT